MRKIVLAVALLGASASGQAADMAVKAPMLKAPAAVLYDWTGFYLGVNGGISVGRDRTSLLTSPPSLLNLLPSAEQVNLSPFGAIGGGQIGYNWQINRTWLIGIETDIQASGQDTSRTCLLSCDPAFMVGRYNQKLDWFGTARARVGLVDGPVLSYFTAGAAYGHYSTSVSELPPIGVATFLTSTNTKVGYTFGSGVEASLGGNWTGKLEYLYIGLGSQTATFATLGGPQTLTTRIRDNIFRGGVNYRIGGTGMTVTPPPANWAGFYVGGNVGSIIGRDPSTLTSPALPTTFSGLAETFHLVPDGYAGGGQIGYNWQSSAWVFGLEADFQGSFARDNNACVALCSPAVAIGIKQTLPWYGTARGRLGYSLGNTLFYGTGGFAYGQTKTELNVFNAAAAPAFASATISRSKGGWTVGAGVESPLQLFGLLGPNWTAKTEYLYVDLGRTTDTVIQPALAPLTFSTRTQEHIFRGGINYHFNAPTIARY